jgi:hypothetical protein
MRTPPPVLPPSTGNEPTYRTTIFDRHGPEAALLIKAGITSAATLVVTFPMFIGGLGLRGISGWKGVCMALALAVVAAAFAWWWPLRSAQAAGEVARAFTMPSGKSTPYEDQHSFQQSLEARGDVAGALESYEAVIAERPLAVQPRMRAAELYARRGKNPVRAAALFREIRDLPSVTIRDAVYASSRLVDLYDGPLNDPGRALVELRRIVECYPSTDIAIHARAALPRLKAQLVAEEAEG